MRRVCRKGPWTWWKWSRDAICLTSMFSFVMLGAHAVQYQMSSLKTLLRTCEAWCKGCSSRYVYAANLLLSVVLSARDVEWLKRVFCFLQLAASILEYQVDRKWSIPGFSEEWCRIFWCRKRWAQNSFVSDAAKTRDEDWPMWVSLFVLPAASALMC